MCKNQLNIYENIKFENNKLSFWGSNCITASDGKSIKSKPLECKKIMAYIPDNPDLYEYMTGIQYLNFISDIYKVNSEFFF